MTLQFNCSATSTAARPLALRRRLAASYAAHCTPSTCLRQHRISRKGRRSLQVCAGQILKVDAEKLQQEITERTTPLVIDFYATWCGPCLLLAKELEKAADQLGDEVKILKVDTDENPELSNQLRIEGLPTMVFVGTDPSKPAIRTEGLLPAETIVQIVKDELANLADAQPAQQ